MNNIKIIDENYVTVQGHYAVINEGDGYAIINTQTKQIAARNIKSFLDCVKTLEYICGKNNLTETAQTSITAPSHPMALVEPIVPNTIQKNSPELDELDIALLKSLVAFFNDMAGKIRRYHNDHNASREEAEVIAMYFHRTADQTSRTTNQQALKDLTAHVEALKQKVSRYQHEKHKYRWSTELETVLQKLKTVQDAF